MRFLNGMNENQKVFVELIVVLILVGFGFWLLTKDKDSASVVTDTGGAEIAPTEDISEGSVNLGSGAASISYQNALIKYKDARIQLDQSCRASPSNVTFKNNTSIMIDNRASLARTVKVGFTFSIKPYGFKIVNLSSATLPATWYIDCNGSQNVATILIQK